MMSSSARGRRAILTLIFTCSLGIILEHTSIPEDFLAQLRSKLYELDASLHTLRVKLWDCNDIPLGLLMSWCAFIIEITLLCCVWLISFKTSHHRCFHSTKIINFVDELHSATDTQKFLRHRRISRHMIIKYCQFYSAEVILNATVGQWCHIGSCARPVLTELHSGMDTLNVYMSLRIFWHS